MFTAIYYRGGSIWALIFLHALLDFGGLFAAYFTTNGGTDVDALNQMNWWGLAIVPVMIGVALYLLRNKKIGEAIAFLSSGE